MQLTALPALADNYIWLLHDDDGNAVVVDPGDASVVESALTSRKLQLRAILLTHHHPDHVGGAAALHRKFSIPVYAPDDERISDVTQRVNGGDCVQLDRPSLHFDVVAVPGHTLSHIAFVGAGMLFCGDTLFSLGCGRLFEGTPAQMLASLDRLAALPGDTQVCAGHEYTAANARFALTLEPDNPALQARAQETTALRAAGLPTLPVSLNSELAGNPFLRVDSPQLMEWCDAQGIEQDRVARFAAVRKAKDGFAG